MGYCSIHGEYHDRLFKTGCPSCQEAQEKAENARESTAALSAESAASNAEIAASNANIEDALSTLIADTREGIARKEESDARVIEALREINNPGEYHCPACRLKTLMQGASRCPRCQKDIEPSFWEEIRRQEEIERARRERERAEQAARAAEEARLRRIEEEKRAAERAAAEEKQRIRNLRILRVAIIGGSILALLWFCTDRVMLMVRRHEFRTAISHKQIDRANELARKLGERYSTAGDLDALKKYLEEKAAFETLLGGQRELLAKYGGDDWTATQTKVRAAEAPGAPAISVQAYLEAERLVNLIKSRLSDMLTAQSAFSKGWEENSRALKQFEPSIYAKLTEGAEQARAMSNPLAARDAWKVLSSDMALAKQGLSKLFDAKMKYEAVEKKIGRELLEKYGKTDWQKAQLAVSQAEKADSTTGAIALWKQAEDAVMAEWASMQTRQSQIKIGCNAPGFKVFLIDPASKLQTPVANSTLSLTPFVEHRIEIRAKGFASAQITVKLDEPGIDCGAKQVVLGRLTEAEVWKQRVAELSDGTVFKSEGPRFLRAEFFSTTFTISGITEVQAYNALEQRKQELARSRPMLRSLSSFPERSSWGYDDIGMLVDVFIKGIIGSDKLEIRVRYMGLAGRSTPTKDQAVNEVVSVYKVLINAGGREG